MVWCCLVKVVKEKAKTRKRGKSGSERSVLKKVKERNLKQK